MKDAWIKLVIPGSVGLALIGSVCVLLWPGGAARLDARLPGQDRPAEATRGPGQAVAGQFVRGEGQPSTLPGLWPRFRGEHFDGINHEPVRLSRQWPSSGPTVLWSIDVGEGYAAAVVRAGRVYLIDYDRQTNSDAIRCLSWDDGREIWRYSYPNPLKRNHGMSRTVPAVTDKYLVTFGPQGHVTCLDPIEGVAKATGKPYWAVDLVRDFGATIPPWYAGQCPLIDGDRAILAPGGPDCLLVALDCQTGKPLWKCANRLGWRMTHSSIMPMQLDERRTYVYCASGGVVGVDAQDGSLLWQSTDWKISIATVPSPLVLPGNRVFLCGGYNSGALMLQITRAGPNQYVAKPLFRLKPDQFGSTQHTPVFWQGFVYGVREKDKQLVCLNLEGNEIWSSGSQYRFGLGPYMVADGMILAMDDTGRLTLAEASPDGFRPLAQAQVLHGHDAWGPMCLANGRLIVRDFVRMICLDVAQRNPAPASGL